MTQAGLLSITCGMAGYEQLLAWRVSNRLAGEVDTLTRGVPFRGHGVLAGQLRRSTVSMVSNIAEGHGRARRGEFAHFLLIARGSGVEAQAQLTLALESRCLRFADYQRCRGQADHAVALITKLHAVVSRQRDRD